MAVRHLYDLDHVDVKDALLKAIEGSGYSLKEEAGVTVLIAGDLPPRQKELLAYNMTIFHQVAARPWPLLGSD